MLTAWYRKITGRCQKCGKKRFDKNLRTLVVDITASTGGYLDEVVLNDVPATWCGTDGCKAIPTEEGSAMVSKAVDGAVEKMTIVPAWRIVQP